MHSRASRRGALLLLAAQFLGGSVMADDLAHLGQVGGSGPTADTPPTGVASPPAADAVWPPLSLRVLPGDLQALVQRGDGNQASAVAGSGGGPAGNTLQQTQFGSGNQLAASQQGAGNTLAQSQLGSGNPMAATQLGGGNQLVEIQIGNRNTGLAVTQSGGAHAVVTQSR